MYTQQWGPDGALYTVTGTPLSLTGTYVYPILYSDGETIDLSKLMVLEIEARIEVGMQEMRKLIEHEHAKYAAGNKCVSSGDFLDYYNAQDK